MDLWTQSSTGCACPGGGGEDCACCVRDGACPCGEIAPTRCAQCGLEQYCSSSEYNIIMTYVAIGCEHKGCRLSTFGEDRTFN